MKNERLIRARIQCGYTQSEIAAKAKISLRAYQNYESGRRCPNVSVARLISQELNVPMDELFCTAIPAETTAAERRKRAFLCFAAVVFVSAQHFAAGLD